MLRKCVTSLSAIAVASGKAKLTDKGKPFALVSREIDAIQKHIHQLVANDYNPVLDHASKYVLAEGGKMMRPALVALMAHAVLPAEVSKRIMEEEIGDLNDLQPDSIRPFLRLAEVTELIHTASLVHDDVIDNSDTRRGRPSLHIIYDAKRAVLAGDYLLAKASYYIATLQVPRIVVLMTTALEELTAGELMQMDGCFDIERYKEKSYCKTAALIANSLASVAVLAERDEETESMAFNFGKNLGIAFQIVDDCLDITSTEKEMGKPKLADFKEGIATLPVLLAAQREPAVDAAVRRRFTDPEDEKTCLEAIERHGTVAEALHQADQHCKLCLQGLELLPHSAARDALSNALSLVLNRKS